jgi:DNA-binding NarL/FixJ family response regulator
MVIELAREMQGAPGTDQLLSRREAQVRSMLRKGLSTAAIAERLEISPITVRRHVSILRRKVGAASRADV